MTWNWMKWNSVIHTENGFSGLREVIDGLPQVTLLWVVYILDWPLKEGKQLSAYLNDSWTRSIAPESEDWTEGEQGEWFNRIAGLNSFSSEGCHIHKERCNIFIIQCPETEDRTNIDSIKMIEVEQREEQNTQRKPINNISMWVTQNPIRNLES